MITAVRKFAANFVKHDIQIRSRTLVKFDQVSILLKNIEFAKPAPPLAHHYRFFPTIGTKQPSRA
jgi:hypothetical protein